MKSLLFWYYLFSGTQIHRFWYKAQSLVIIVQFQTLYQSVLYKRFSLEKGNKRGEDYLRICLKMDLGFDLEFSDSLVAKQILRPFKTNFQVVLIPCLHFSRLYFLKFIITTKLSLPPTWSYSRFPPCNLSFIVHMGYSCPL